MARLLIEKGYRDVWPLLGGFDGWVELGYPTEPVAPPRPDYLHRGGKFFGVVPMSILQPIPTLRGRAGHTTFGGRKDSMIMMLPRGWEARTITGTPQ